MFLNPRDHEIARTVDALGQVTTGTIEAIHFHGLSSQTPLKRAMLRLVDPKLKVLSRMELPNRGGSRGGSSPYVYQLGPAGWKLFRGNTRYWPYRAVNYHMLTIGNALVSLKRLEHTGRFQVTRYRTEPKNWVTMAGVELRPDLYVELTNLESGKTYSCWIEVDMGTERKPQLKAMLARYYHAWQHRQEGEYDQWPLVFFLVPDVDRKDELERLIAQGSEEARALFVVRLFSEFPPANLSM
ncbi:replication-relaxation family protein [Streptomyces cinereoruber]|uniref:replication-relaxation family protein n=1 Tax=Streptomyces cinereoruber TaxID=67260 RepID=UPI00363B6822